MSPARSMSRWLTTSASAGSSRDVEMKNCETRMIVSSRKRCLFYRASAEGNGSGETAMNFARWLWRRATGDADAVYITERFGVRSLHIGSSTIQSSMRLAHPNDLEL